MRARVEQRGRARHEVERGQHVVELDRARFAVDLVQREAHGDAHEEALRQLEAPARVPGRIVLVDQEIAVVQRL
jgi:multidrug resistance efflux pump